MVGTYPDIGEKRRSLILKIWAGYNPMDKILHRMHWLDVNVPYKAKVDAGLEWLLRNGIIGQKFVDFFEGECNGSDLHFYTILNQKVEKENEARRLIYRKDFIK